MNRLSDILIYWKYIFHNESQYDKWTWRKVWCRLRGHPYGVSWYNPGGLEPDMTCTNCGDDLG